MAETKTELDVSIEEVTHAVAEITKMDTVIAELHQKYGKVIFDVDTADGMNSAKDARKEIREPRYLIENLRKEGKRPILALGRQLDARAGEMTDAECAREVIGRDPKGIEGIRGGGLGAGRHQAGRYRR